MDRLNQLLARFERQRDAGSVLRWAGPRPDGRGSKLSRLLVEKIGYREAAGDWEPEEISRDEAAGQLAFLAIESLAYGAYGPPRAGLKDLALEALGDLGPEARFYVNGWLPKPGQKGMGWTGLSTATFDAGVLGFDDRNAFVFWIEEED
ncbi:hypothetical protein [Caulobacter endophyticus]|uniref:hypothetical protein n=1 Tax=Caulobacter endophyticus TaxID=2172652 RepID=UPI002410A427|nr:hypothetical protein [Caulobacter endophyticus]MDG2530341.1 hypothetical protein [Caulobacter endophyticus]